jgi:hypothetical protein
MLTCEKCRAGFAVRQVIAGKERDLHGRKRCPACLPYRTLTRPRRRVAHSVKQLLCGLCRRLFPAKAVVDGTLRSLYRRRFCLECSPFGMHNTSKTPPGSLNFEELIEHRRRRRNAKTYRYQKKRRRELKAQLVAARGGHCEDCGYRASLAALDFHHRDARSKEFALSKFNGSRERLFAEAEKCVLVCANCHRLRHLAEDASARGGPVVEFRRRLKARAVQYMGTLCSGCHRGGPQAIFEFHHLDASEKEFGITQDGVPRRWEKIVAELAKCVMLCANCHREVHAGVRELEEGLLGLAEEAALYSAA